MCCCVVSSCTAWAAVISHTQRAPVPLLEFYGIGISAWASWPLCLDWSCTQKNEAQVKTYRKRCWSRGTFNPIKGYLCNLFTNSQLSVTKVKAPTSNSQIHARNKGVDLFPCPPPPPQAGKATSNTLAACEGVTTSSGTSCSEHAPYIIK